MIEYILKAEVQAMCCRYLKLRHYVFPLSDFHSICGMAITPDCLEAFQFEIRDVELTRWDGGSVFFDVVEHHVVFPHGIGSLGTPSTIDPHGFKAMGWLAAAYENFTSL